MPLRSHVPNEADERTGQGIVVSRAETGLAERQSGGAVGSAEVSLRRVEYAFRGRTYSFGTAPVFLLSLVVGVVGGVYGVGGGAIIATLLVSFVRLPVHTVAGATLAGTFLTSAAGIVFYAALAGTGLGAGARISPDWSLGLLLGAGGLAGSYVGATVQRYLPELWLKTALGVLITLLALHNGF